MGGVAATCAVLKGISMNVDMEDLSAAKKRLLVTVPTEEVNAEFNAAYKTMAKTVTVHGFRKGKVPRDLIKRLYKVQVQDEIKKKLIARSMDTAFTEHAIKPVGTPTAEIEDLEEGKPFHFTLSFEVRPGIELGDLSTLTIAAETIDVADEEIERGLESLQHAHAEIRSVDGEREVRSGDFVSLDFIGYLDGVEIPGEKRTDYLVEIGAGPLSNEIEEAIIGMRRGEEKEIAVTYPETGPKKGLAGRQIDYQVVVKDHKEKILPEIDDEFARDVGEFDGFEALKAHLRERMFEEKKRRMRDALKEGLVDKLIERAPLDVPESLLKSQKAQIRANVVEEQRRKGTTSEEMDKISDELTQKIDESALRQVRRFLLLEEIAEAQGFDVTDAEADAEIEKIAESTGKQVEMIRGRLQKDNSVDRLKLHLREEKSLSFLYQKATIENWED